jgi:hypothetical protein
MTNSFHESRISWVSRISCGKADHVSENLFRSVLGPVSHQSVCLGYDFLEHERSGCGDEGVCSTETDWVSESMATGSRPVPAPVLS